jgi:shikimate dehydrogenase
MAGVKITGSTRLAGLMGWPVGHSLSPAIHNALAAALKLDFAYVPLPVPPAAVGQAVAGLAALGFLGVNVTVPHKEAVLPYLDYLEPAAQAIGAVNTILVTDRLPPAAGGRTPAPERRFLVGDNTDWTGFLEDLMALGLNVAGEECLVLGAGGSARAVVYALHHAGSRVRLFARRVEQAQALARALQVAAPCHNLADLATASYRWEREPVLIVNTTPLGMAPDVDASPWPEHRPLPAHAFVYDLVYNPTETKLMRQARAAGCRSTNGLGTLVRQGAHAFRLWTGQEADLNVMWRAVDKQHRVC